ncbi:MAG: SCO family protein [Oceanococcaceae bacterium]
MRRPHLNRLLLGGLALILVLGLLGPRLLGLGGATQLGSGLLLDQPRPLSSWGDGLVDDDGQRFQLEQFRGKHHLLFFGFANCPDICPNTMYMAGQMMQALPPADQDKLQVVLISLDPERDSPENLQQYVRSFHPSFKALTGSEEALTDLSGQAGIAWMKVEQGESYTIDHSAALVLLDPEARIQAYFAPPLAADKLAADLEQLL